MEFKLGLVRKVWEPPAISAIASAKREGTTTALTLLREETDLEASDRYFMLSDSS